MPSGLVQIIGPEAYKKILEKQNHYLHQYKHFTLFNTTTQQMSIIREELTKIKVIRRIIRTYNQAQSNKWLIETTLTNLRSAQQLTDTILDANEEELGKLKKTTHNPMRLDPKLNHADYYTRTQKIRQDTSNQEPNEDAAKLQSPPVRKTPIMASYIIPTNPKTYKSAVQVNPSPTQDDEVIHPTYTEIDWEKNAENERRNHFGM